MSKDPIITLEAANAVEAMRHHGTIIYPTDTVWGIGCDATDPVAVEKVYALKKRADHRAMLVLVDSLAMLERYVANVPEVAYELIEAAVNPLTIVYDKGVGLAPNLLGPDGSIGIRLTREPFTAALCRALRRPIVSTSANISGNPAAATYPQIDPALLRAADYVVNYRRDDLAHAKPSSVIKLTDSGVITILRP